MSNVFHADRFFWFKDDKKMNYKVEPGEDFILKLHYASGYLHEALCFFNDINLRKNRFILPIKRFRWELLKDRDTNNIQQVDSILSITNIFDFELVINNFKEYPRNISDIWRHHSEIEGIYFSPAEHSIIIWGKVFILKLKILQDVAPIIYIKDN